MADTVATRLPRFVAVGEALTDLIRVEGDHWNGETGNHYSCEERECATAEPPSAFYPVTPNGLG